MLVYRISKKAYINDLSGTGAGLYGGRWNPKGLNLVYTAANIALAYVEFLVHNYHLLTHTEVCMACIEIPVSGKIITYQPEDLPGGWNERDNRETRMIGQEFIRDNKSYLLKVPSAVVPGEYNILLNPLHTNHQQIKIKEVIDPLIYDTRLLQHLRKKDKP